METESRSNQTLNVTIGGMSCSHCVAAVKERLESTAGVQSVAVSIGSASMEIDAGQATSETVRSAIEDEGYSVESISS